MPKKSNGDYYYVESETINDLLDGFQIYDDGSGNITFHDTENDAEYKVVAGTGFSAPSGVGYAVDGTQVVGAQQGTYSPTNVTTDRTFDADSAADAELADVLGTLIADLQAHGLIG